MHRVQDVEADGNRLFFSLHKGSLRSRQRHAYNVVGCGVKGAETAGRSSGCDAQWRVRRLSKRPGRGQVEYTGPLERVLACDLSTQLAGVSGG